MKAIDTYINEKLVLNKDNIKDYTFNYHPKDKYELVDIIINRVIANGKRKVFHGNLNDIDVSSISDFSGLVSIGLRNYNIKLDRLIGNIDISQWDVSNMTSAQSMFFNCKSFNCDLSNWNVENLENASAMFAGCEELDFDISKWNPIKLKESDKTWKMIVNTKLKKQDWMR